VRLGVLIEFVPDEFNLALLLQGLNGLCELLFGQPVVFLEAQFLFFLKPILRIAVFL
jgi:hypothetical protein